MNGHYRGYSDFSESGVEWIGRVPTHWKPLKFKRALSEKKHTLNPDLPAGSISFGSVVYKNSETLADATKASYQEVLPDEFLVNPLNLNFDLKSLRTALSDIAVVVSTGYIVLRSRSRLDRRFTRWLLQEFDVAHMKTLGAGVRQTINFTDIGNSIFFAPPLEEQTQIAKFLDYETAKIDALIEKQQQLIALLKEKRQAVISHAVTKGLNPDALMRDSGVEWLGEVPAHWKTCGLKRYAAFVDGDRGNQYPGGEDLIDQGVVFLSSKNIVDERLELTNLIYISREKFESLNRGKAQDGDLIVKVRGSVGRIGELAKFEVSALREAGAAGSESNTAFINAQMMIIRTESGLLADYLRLVSSSLYWTEQLAVGAYGTAQQQLSNRVFADLLMVLPPVSEQAVILSDLEHKSAALDGLITGAQEMIALIRERRTALISAAVTGKIDVRGWKAPDSEPEPEVA